MSKTRSMMTKRTMATRIMSALGTHATLSKMLTRLSALSSKDKTPLRIGKIRSSSPGRS